VRDCTLERCLVAEGCLLNGAALRRSVVGLRAHVGPGAVIEDSVLMGADFYEVDEKRERVRQEKGLPPVGVGPNASVRRAIVDKNARIGAGAVLHGHPDRPDEDHADWVVRDGIIIVAKGAHVPAGAVL
jgi:glucose-1-phosphate adenylyltransferase